MGTDSRKCPCSDLSPTYFRTGWVETNQECHEKVAKESRNHITFLQKQELDWCSVTGTWYIMIYHTWYIYIYHDMLSLATFIVIHIPNPSNQILADWKLIIRLSLVPGMPSQRNGREQHSKSSRWGGICGCIYSSWTPNLWQGKLICTLR